MAHKIKPEEEKYYALADLRYFCKKYFSVDLPHHHISWAKIADTPGNHVIFAPASHGKTTLFSNA